MISRNQTPFGLAYKHCSCTTLFPCPSLHQSVWGWDPHPARAQAIELDSSLDAFPCPNIQCRASVLPNGLQCCLLGAHPKQLLCVLPSRQSPGDLGPHPCSLLNHTTFPRALFLPWPRPLSLVPGSSRIKVCLSLFLAPCPVPHLALSLPLLAERPSTERIRCGPPVLATALWLPAGGPVSSQNP